MIINDLTKNNTPLAQDLRSFKIVVLNNQVEQYHRLQTRN